ncbi:MAG: hypothetical protein J7L76_02130 [Spirochaetaceae bacterium]|nr:hypothetical protein [Spirochaetaceae bacterium]
MDPLPRNVWKRLSRLFPADKAAAASAAELFREYESDGYLGRPSAEILTADLPVIVDFFRRVALMHSFESPILRRRDTRWMSEFDYTLVNIRAAGIENRPGNFLRASFFLATLRTRGIILAPITKGASENLEILESHAHIREELADRSALEAGITPELQAAAFCEAAHLLSLALGYELDYHVDPLAAVVLNRPDLFFWTKDGEFTPDEAVQDELREEVRSRVAAVRKTGVAMDRKVYSSALEMTGLAALPSTDGTSRTSLALRLAANGDIGEHRDTAVAYWGRVFDLWRDRYGFDFLLLKGTREFSDRSLARKAADAARKAGVRRNIGVAAEGKTFDVESFGVQGVDLVFDDDAEEKADMDWFGKTFALDEKLRRVNLGRKLRFSVPLAVNPGEKESRPRRERAHIKRFVARFLGSGPSRRPLLETMGALEGAWGYRGTIERAVSMGWLPDASDAAVGHSIEDVAGLYKDMIDGGERLDKHVSGRSAWWVIRSRRGLLIAVISVENEDLLPPEPMKIDYSSYLKEKETMTVLEYDFRGDRGLLHLSVDTFIDTGNIPYRGFRLYVVT